MKKWILIFILFFSLLLIGSNTYAAGSSLSFVSKIDSVNVEIGGQWGEVAAVIKNNSFLTQNIGLRMTLISVVPGHLLSFCWNECLPPDMTKQVIESSGTIPLSPGATTESKFVVDFSDTSSPALPGESIAKFDIFVENNPDDFITLTMNFSTRTTSVSENENHEQVGSFISPNPVSGAALISYNTPSSANREINIYSITGSLVKSYKMESGSNSMLINTEELPQGSYYYSILENGVIKETKPFMVVR